MTEEEQIKPIEIIDEPEPECVAVRVIETHGKSVLVERVDDYRRYLVPASKVGDHEIDAAELDKCPAYGIPWERYLSLDSLTGEALALMLRQAGIYTLEDLRVRDRQLIRIGTNSIGQVVRDAAKRAAKAKPPKEQ